ITRRNRGVPLARVIAELNAYLSGWVTYFRHARCQTQLRRLEAWIRRKLRCFRLKQCKRPRAQADFLRSLGVPEWRAWRLALSGKGCWRKAQSWAPLLTSRRWPVYDSLGWWTRGEARDGESS